MTRSIDFAVIDNLHASASRGQHAHVIQETVAIANELQNLRLHLLDMRARSYVACAQFAKALETATTMQEMNPASALGYLCQGYIHMEQGRYITAVHVYEKAMECVDKRDPSYETIITSKDKALQQGERCRDFICDFPIDISARIIQELYVDEKYPQQREYVMVSWDWWHRIMAANHLEYSLDSIMALEETSDMVIQSFNHVRSLTYYYGDGRLSQLLERYPFTSLTTLQLNGATVEETMGGLSLIGMTLTTLIYEKPPLGHNNDYTIRLRDILATCPNLVSFNCQSAVDISSLKVTYPKLRTLEMYSVIGTVDDQVMVMLQQHLPSLRALDMAIVGSSRPVTVDDPWIPAIRHLGYGECPSTYHQNLTFEEYEEQGLVSLSIVPTRHLFALDAIAPLIIHHHATLQLLALRGHFNTTHTGNMTDAMHNYRSVEFTRLKRLLLWTVSENTNMESYASFIAWIIQRAPFLQEITLHGNMMNKYTLQAMAKCAHLRSVSFATHPTQRSEDYDAIVSQFVKDHANYTADKGGSRLEVLNVRLHKADAMLIDGFRGLKSLTSLYLFTNDIASEPFVRLFESLRQGCQSLEDLHLHNDGMVPNRILYQVGGCANLKRLIISGDIREAQAGLLGLQRCSHLQHLSTNYPIDEDIKSMIREKLPDCSITGPPYPFSHITVVSSPTIHLT